MTMQADKTITIDLDKLDSTEARGENELIFQEEYHRLIRSIRKKAEANRRQLKEQGGNRENDDEARVVPSCFFIDGSRGSGKSTLMRTVRDSLVTGKKVQKDESSFNLYPLADVDPTELGKGENFFLYILGKIYKILEEHYRKCEVHDEDVNLIRAAMQDLRTMSGGLQVLMDSNEALKNDDNPDFFLENCVEKCADSVLLRNRLCNILSKVAKIVHADVFLVTIDDADLNFSKCEDVLEYVRKYMQSPRLIFLFAGDMQLYSHIVRGMYISHFRKKQLVYDVSHESHRRQLLDRLEEQYILKLFPVDNRVQTPGLKKILEGKRELFIRWFDKGEKTQPLLALLEEYLSSKIKLGDMKRFKDSIFMDSILQLPTRSVFFLLRYLIKNPFREYPEHEEDSLRYIWDGIQEVFLQALIRYNVDYSQMGGGNIELVQKTIFSFCADEMRWNADLSLLPTESNVSSRQVSLYLSGIVSQGTRSLSAKLRYWCACFPAWQSIREYYLDTYDVHKTRMLLDYCLKLGDGESEKNWANLACAGMAPNVTDGRLYRRGAVCLLNDDLPQNKEMGHEARLGCRKMLDTLAALDVEDSAERKKFAIGVCASLCRVDDRNRSDYYLSVYHLLMNIAEWLDFGKRHIEALKAAATDAELQKKIKQDIQARLAEIRAVPSTLRVGSFEASERKSVSVSRLKYVYRWGQDDSLTDEIYQWLTDYADQSYMSSSLDFSRAWEVFLGKCNELTGKYTPQYENESHCPKAGAIMLDYMRAVEEALACIDADADDDESDALAAAALSDAAHAADSEGYVVVKHKLTVCVKEFPFWKTLRTGSSNSYVRCMEVLNSANIGAYVNEEQKRKVAELKKKVTDLSEPLAELRMQVNMYDEEWENVQHLLCDAQLEKGEKEVEMKLHDAQVKHNDEEEENAKKTIDDLLKREEELALEIAELKDEEMRKTEEYKQASLKLSRIEKTLNREATDFPEYEVLNAELKNALRLLNHARTDATRQKHEAVMTSIREKIEMHQEEQKKKLPKNALSQARKVKENTGNELKTLEKKRKVAESTQFSTKRKRSWEERRFSSQQERNSVIRKSAVDSQIDFELADMKCRRLEKEVSLAEEKWQQAQDALQKQEKKIAEATAAYEAAKKPDTEL